MRSRSNSGVRLDYYHRLIDKSILAYQNPVTGLFQASETNKDAWVRDNVYSIMVVWGLAMAYRKQADLDEDRAKAYALEQEVVKLMRGLLMCMMKQVGKLETFKHTQSDGDSLHAKYSSETGDTCVGDNEWGHLQLDATSLYLLMMSQMTASGLQIIFTMDEVALVQNLVFYIENAFRIADYGIWERGDKTNHGFPELNASSIGMAKAAMEAINELDLFCGRGGTSSIIHVKPDKVAQCQAILHSMLPRESSSKEIDAGLLSVIGFPAFAVDDESIINHTRQQIINKLQGNYGCRRFLRDGYKTAREDPNRLYYEPAELKIFENIECEWPVFFAYLLLDGIFHNNKEQVNEYADALEDVMVHTQSGLKLLPELYIVPAEKVELEYKTPKSQERVPGGKVPHLWGQSLYILCCLLKEKYIAPGEVDPLNRRHCTRPKPDLVVQVALLSEDTVVQEILKANDIETQTVAQVSPIHVYPSRVLIHIFKQLGRNDKLKLTGNVSKDIGVLSTSMLYTLHGQILAFVPQFLDHHQFYLALDNNLLADLTKSDIGFLRYNWRELGRPTITITVTHAMIEENNLQTAILSTIKKMQAGYINGVQVQIKKLANLIDTSCVKRLTFLESEHHDDASLALVLGRHSDAALYPSCPKAFLPKVKVLHNEDSGTSTPQSTSSSERTRKLSGIIQRTRSIDIGGGFMLPPVFSISEEFEVHFSSPKPSNHLPAITGFGVPLAERRSLRDQAFSPISVSLGEELFSPSPISPDSSQQHFFLPESLSTSKMKRIPSWMDTSELFQMYSGQENAELIIQLQSCTTLSEQADIVHYLYESEGLDYDTKMDGKSVTVKNLMEELYYKSAHHKMWSLVRHTAGILQKRLEHLAQAVTDLLVRQKQVSVGLPPEPREKIIMAPLPPKELQSIIYEACGDDRSCAVLTQEILFYLSMFIKTEPQLFMEMFRLRVGLIMQVMTTELARTLNCDAEDAYEHLVTLSPYEVKELLHHILSGREFSISISPQLRTSSGNISSQKKIVTAPKDEVSGISQLKRQVTRGIRRGLSRQETCIKDIIEDNFFEDRYGQWLRRRRLDGSLNRVPADFYVKVWNILEKCDGLNVQGKILPQMMTREMTPNEFKFALQVETVLNTIPQPEYRQLMVEAMMVVSVVVENDWLKSLGPVIEVGGLIQEANRLFLADQAEFDGDAKTCCAADKPPDHSDATQPCEGTHGICNHFYDSAPSGRYGTMIYLAKAAASRFNLHDTFGGSDRVECKTS